jgi:hypothetical protein
VLWIIKGLSLHEKASHERKQRSSRESKQDRGSEMEKDRNIRRTLEDHRFT